MAACIKAHTATLCTNHKHLYAWSAKCVGAFTNSSVNRISSTVNIYSSWPISRKRVDRGQRGGVAHIRRLWQDVSASHLSTGRDARRRGDQEKLACSAALYRSPADEWPITGLCRPPQTGALAPLSVTFVAGGLDSAARAACAGKAAAARNRQPAPDASSGGIKYRHNLLDRMTTLQVLCAICPLQIGPLIEMAKCALMYEKICLARRFSRGLYTGEQWFRPPYLTGAAVATVIGYIEKSYFPKRNIPTQCISSFVYSISEIRFCRGRFAGRLGL